VFRSRKRDARDGVVGKERVVRWKSLVPEGDRFEGDDQIVAQHPRRARHDATQSTRRGRIGVGEVEQNGRDAVAIYGELLSVKRISAR
jgi:hypothetical protein